MFRQRHARTALALGFVLASALLGTVPEAAAVQSASVTEYAITDPSVAASELLALAESSDRAALNLGVRGASIPTNLPEFLAWQARIDQAGNFQRIETQAASAAAHKTVYWDNGAGELVYGIDTKTPQAQAALKLLGKRGAKWVRDTSISRPAGESFRATMLPSWTIASYAVPELLVSTVRLTYAGTVTGYRIVYSSPAVGRELDLSISVDPDGRVTDILERYSSASSRSFTFDYGEATVTLPSKSGSVTATDWARAGEAVDAGNKLRIVIDAVAANLAAQKLTPALVASTSRTWVKRLNQEWLIDAKWAKTRTGANIWLDNPFTKKREGVYLSVAGTSVGTEPYQT